MEGLTLVGKTDWKEIFEAWRSNEASQEGWQKVAREKGWENWEEWRRYIAGMLGLPAREWKLYSIDHPEKILPNFLVGPYPGWQNALPLELQNKLTFKEYLEFDRKHWETHGKVQDLLINFPVNTHLTGLFIPETQQIVCLEGSHRSLSATLAQEQNIQLAPARIALARMSLDESGLLEEVLQKGTNKPTLKK